MMNAFAPLLLEEVVVGGHSGPSPDWASIRWPDDAVARELTDLGAITRWCVRTRSLAGC